MTMRVSFETAKTNERAASAPKKVKGRALVPALLGCLLWLPLPSPAEAAPFQQYKNGVCTSSSICTIDFAVVPAGRRLEITNASCYLRTSLTNELSAMQFLVIEGTATRSALTLVPSFVDTISVPGETFTRRIIPSPPSRLPDSACGPMSS